MRQTLNCRHFNKKNVTKNNNNYDKINENNTNISPSDSTDVKLVSPVKSYGNAELLKDNNKQSGIYRRVNNVNGKTYVGSGVNLTKRLRSYYNNKELNRKPRPIQDALLKYGHKNFSLDIFEYCPNTKLLEREQFYLDLLIPEYNICILFTWF